MDGATEVYQFVRVAGLIPAVLVLFSAWFVASLVNRFLVSIGDRFTDRRLQLQQIGTFARFFIYFVGIATAVLLSFHFSDQMLLALGGTVAVALGFALKDIASSILAGLVILIDRPFQVGDRITFDGAYGEVARIGLRSVRLVTLDDNMVTIPNHRFMSEMVASGNAGALDMMVVVDFYVDLYEDIGAAQRIVEDAVRASRFAYLQKPWSVSLGQVQFESFVSLRIRARVYVLDLKYEKQLESDITERVLTSFRERGIRQPGVSSAAVHVLAAQEPAGKHE